jgi:hypothetical protein
MLSTIPRSGTWGSIYLFHTYREFLKGNQKPDIVALHANATNRSDKKYLQEFGVSPLLVDHYPCFGFDRLGSQATQQFESLTHSLGSLKFFRTLLARHRWMSPQSMPRSRYCFILRNPLDISSAKLQPAERPAPPQQKWFDTLRGRKTTGYTFNPQWPLVPGEPKSQLSLFDEVIANFRVSRLMDAYVVYMMSFVFMQQAFPHNIIIIPYEDTQSDPVGSYLKVLAHFGLAEAAGAKYEEYVRRAVEFTSYERMKEYEARLGQSISTPPIDTRHKAGTWQSTKTHLPVVKHKPWQQLFSKEDFRHVIDTLGQYNLMPELIGAEFARELRELAK